MMGSHEFRLVLDGPAVASASDDEAAFDALAEALFAAGCDDGTFGLVDGVGSLDFDREAANFAEAVGSAIEDVRKVAGLSVVRVSPERELVTLSEIARRLGRSRESVRLSAKGDRGPGGFPRPVAKVGSSHLWRWTDVALWYARVAEDPKEAERLEREAEESRLLEWLNGVLRLQEVNLEDAATLVRGMQSRLMQLFPFPAT